MAIIFDGRSYSQKKELEFKSRVSSLKEKGIYPYLISIIVGDDPASILYVNLKKRAAERIGARVDIVSFSKDADKDKIIAEIKKYNDDPSITGIMIQLPFPEGISSFKNELISSIDKNKDVDGLRGNSKFIHPTAGAVLQIIKEALRLDIIKTRPVKVYVLGKGGMVGSSLVSEIEKSDMVLFDNMKLSDVVISATGKPSVIKGSMVGKGCVVIDVGSPIGDVDFDSVLKKASFITPVPGGVGPMTITFLLDNLISACK